MPRQAERTVLHQVVREHLESFLATTTRADPAGVPAFLEQEFRAFLECGVWSRGFARFQCQECHADTLVPFSCKRRGFCPSCCGRRMAAGAAELVDHILPHVPIRQWVLSLPHALRYRLAWDHVLCRAVLAIYTRALLGFERRRGQRRGIVDGRSGTVTAIQRFGGGLQLNVHFHTLLLEGVFARDLDGTTRFHPGPRCSRAPTARSPERTPARRPGRPKLHQDGAHVQLPTAFRQAISVRIVARVTISLSVRGSLVVRAPHAGRTCPPAETREIFR